MFDDFDLRSSPAPVRDQLAVRTMLDAYQRTYLQQFWRSRCASILQSGDAQRLTNLGRNVCHMHYETMSTEDLKALLDLARNRAATSTGALTGLAYQEIASGIDRELNRRATAAFAAQQSQEGNRNAD